MSTGEQKRSMMVAIASASAALILLGSAFLLYRSRKQVQQRDPKVIQDVLDDVQLLGEPCFSDKLTSSDSKDQDKLLDKKYFIDLVALITFHSRAEFKEEKKALLQKRRELYDTGDDSKYEDVVREIYIKQEIIFNQLCDEVLDAIEISKDVFLAS